MSLSRVIEVSFNGGSIAYVKADTAYFYNNGIIFKPTDIDLPASYQVHWADSPQASSTLETIGTAEGAPIPDDLWDRSRVIYGWIYLHPTNDSGITAYEVRIYKNVRAGLPDGTEPTPEEQSTIDQAISALNTAVAKTAQDVISADQSARSASGDADRAERARTGAETAQGKAEKAQESAERAKDDAETSERNASESERKAKGYAETASEKADAITGLTAQATTLPDGSSATASYDAETGVMSFGIPKGKDGTDGDDGYSPTANVSKTGKVATITITDKNGTTSAQVEDGTDGIDGISPSVSVTDITGGHRVVITDKDGTKSFDVEDGATGATPNLTIGTVETLEPTDDATATITGTAENPVLNLGIPQGDAGEVTLADLNSALIEKAPVITDTASGAVASFPDGADGIPLKSLVVDINPVQDLSHGDPSPENICPISGWTGCKVQRTGKNLCDANNLASTPTPIGNRHGVTISKAGTYTIHSDAVGMGNAYIYAYPVNADGTYGALKYIVAGTVRTATTITITDGVKLIVVDAARANSMAASKALFESWQIQIELGSIATPYEPYTGRSITIQLGQTVYGGKLDVLSGELVVDMGIVDLGTLTWSYYAGDNYAMFLSSAINDIKKSIEWRGICSIYGIARTGIQSIADKMISNGYADGRIRVKDSRFTDVNSFVADVTGQTLVYELDTPIKIQLTPHQVNSLLGVNNIWADSGDTEVEYRADTKLFIERLTAPDSADMIADANIQSGKYFMVGNNLYKATANIANGSAIVVGTNCIRKSLSEALNEINA